MDKPKFISFEPIDDQLILSYCQQDNIHWSELSFQLSRPEHVIVQRAFQLGAIKFSDYNHLLLSHRKDGWRSDEIDFLILYSSVLTTHQLALSLGRTKSSVSKQIFEFKLCSATHSQWSDSDNHMLKAHIKKHGVKYVAKQIDRSLIEVKYNAIKQGLSQEGFTLTFFSGRRKSVPVNLGECAA